MANKVILVDTSILIDYYRKTDKNNSIWLGLVRSGYEFAISVVTKYEIYSGASINQLEFWDTIMNSIHILPLDEHAINTAVRLNAELKRKRKQIDIADLFIAATSISNNLEMATLNRKHFERIDDLKVL